MSLTRPSLASVLLLSFCTFSEAWVLHRKSAGRAQDAKNVAPVELRRNHAQADTLEKRQETELYCPDDRWQEFLNSNPENRIETFCNEWLGIAPATTVLEYTPTITITTSAATVTTVTSTTRILTSSTVTATATTTLAPLLPRAANIAAAVAEDIINSVIESGTTSAAVASKNEQRIQAESGLANACSCKMVDPTATVTTSFAVPPVYTTVGFRVISLSTITETRIFTALYTVTEVPGVSTSSNSSVSASSVDTSADSSAPASTPLASGPASTSATLSISSNATIVSRSSTFDTATPVVTAIPFRCPDAANTNVDQVVGGFRLDYLVLCNTEIISQDRLYTPIDTDDETACTAQCSVVNAKSGQNTCLGATFTPYTDGRSGGSCVLSGADPEYADKDGSTVVVPIGISANGNECDAFEGAGISSSAVDNSSLVASITSVGISITTPGLLTQTADGGVFETYVSANSTDAGGTVHWSWYRVSASSSFWWAVYATSWSCTRTITQTIVQQPPTAEPITITTALITTIINGATTTIISGGSTSIIYGDGGIITPTFVPAFTTSGNGEFTTFFSEATQTSTGASGIIPPTPGAAVSSSLPVASEQASTLQGSAIANVSGSTATFISTGSQGIVEPSPTTLVVSNSPVTLTTNETTVVIIGSAQFSSSGSTATLVSTGNNGAVPPGASSSGSAALTVSSVVSTSTYIGDTGGYGPGSSTTDWTYPANSTSPLTLVGSANLTVSGATSTITADSSEGIIIPSIDTASSSFAPQTIQAVSNSTLPGSSPTPIVTVSVGSFVSTTSGAISAFNSTGSAGQIPPNPTSSNSVVSSESVSLGSANITIGSSTLTFTSTDGGGVIPPASSSSGLIQLPSSNISSSVFAVSTSGINVSVIVSSGGIVSTTSGSTATFLSTGSEGIITPVSTGILSSLLPNSTSTSPPNMTVSSGAVTFSTSGSTDTLFSTAASGEIPPASANSTVPLSSSVPATSLPSPPASSLNISSTFSGSISDQPRTPFPTTSSSVPSLASSSVLPSSNSSSVLSSSAVTSPPSLVSSTPIPVTLNSSSAFPCQGTLTTPGCVFTNSDQPRTPFPQTQSSSGPPISSGTAVPSMNSSITPTSSMNISSASASSIFPCQGTVTTSGCVFTNSDEPRTPFPQTSSSASVGSVSIVSSANSSIAATPGVTPSTSVATTSSAPPTSSVTGPASSSIPIASNNGNSSVPASSGSSSAPSLVLPTPSGNLTASVPPPVSTQGMVSTSLNSSVVSSSIPPVSSNSTSLTSSGASSFIPSVSANSTGPATTSTPGPFSSIPGPSVNITSSPPAGETPIIPPFGGNTTAPPITVASVGSISVSLNSTIPTPPPFTNITSVPSATPSISFNFTSVPSRTPSASLNITSVPSVTPSNSLNITSTPPYPTGNSTVPSSTPTISLNSSTSDTCPTAAITVTQLSVSVATTTEVVTIVQTSIQIQTVLAIALDFASTSASAESSSTVSPPSATPTPFIPSDLDSRFRTRGTPATQDQIAAACADTGNIVLNPDFAQRSDGQVPGWSVDSNDPNIAVNTIDSPSGNGTIAQFRSAAAGRELTTMEPLTLCPGAQYTFAASARQANTLADCSVQYTIVDGTGAKNNILSVDPQTTWLRKDAFFTAGEGSAGAEVEVWITARCDGYGGFVVSDDEGWMRVEVQGVSVVRDV